MHPCLQAKLWRRLLRTTLSRLRTRVPQKGGAELFRGFIDGIVDGLGLEEAAAVIADVASAAEGIVAPAAGALDYLSKFVAYANTSAFISECFCALTRDTAWLHCGVCEAELASELARAAHSFSFC